MVGKGIALLFHDLDTSRGEWSAARPGRSLPPGKTWYPLYRRLGGPQGRSGQAENLAPPGFDSRTVQPLAQSLSRLSYPAHPLFVCELSIHFSFTYSSLFSNPHNNRIKNWHKMAPWNDFVRRITPPAPFFPCLEFEEVTTVPLYTCCRAWSVSPTHWVSRQSVSLS
jgi:hypothetical protein